MTILSSVAIIVSGKECLKDWLIVGRVTRAIHMESHNGYGYESASSFLFSPYLAFYVYVSLEPKVSASCPHVPSLDCLHNVQSLLSTALSI